MSHRPQTTIVPVVSSVGQIAAGGYHTCALKTDGSVVCWGRNFAHQSTPPAGLVACNSVPGANHSCAVKADGTVACWGDDLEGQSSVPPGLLAVQVGAGANHTCAVTQDATVVCWGVTNPADDKGQTTVPAGLTSVTEVAGGADHTCALKTDGTVVCSGNRFQRPAADSGRPDCHAAQRLPAPSHMRPSTKWRAGLLGIRATGGDASGNCGQPDQRGRNTHLCRSTGRDRDLLGLLTASRCPKLKPISAKTIVPAGLASVVQVSSGGFHTCALKSDGTVVCSGTQRHERNRRPTRPELDRHTAPVHHLHLVAPGFPNLRRQLRRHRNGRRLRKPRDLQHAHVRDVHRSWRHRQLHRDGNMHRRRGSGWKHRLLLRATSDAEHDDCQGTAGTCLHVDAARPSDTRRRLRRIGQLVDRRRRQLHVVRHVFGSRHERPALRCRLVRRDSARGRK